LHATRALHTSPSGVDPASIFEAIKGGLASIELPREEPQA